MANSQKSYINNMFLVEIANMYDNLWYQTLHPWLYCISGLDAYICAPIGAIYTPYAMNVFI